MTPPALTYEVKGRKAYVALNRPHALNALNGDLRRSLADAMQRADADDSVSVVILGGEGGRAFSAGGDMKEAAARAQETKPESTPRAHPPVAKAGAMFGFDEVDACSKPVIAAIDGYCIGGGLEIALYCDFRFATRKSTFGLPEPRHNIFPAVSLIHLSRMIPLGDALMLQLTGEPIGAERALQVGLIQGVFEDRDALNVAVEKAAAAIVASPPLVVQFIKRVVKEGREMTVEQQWRFQEMFGYQLRQMRSVQEVAK